ncbi:MAG: AsmA-like C-terminal region-containing protein, partial [Planctomycetes bacterium]|nr:AsmA-like C-terminal region-containing protein [Planctomycetota bacterium]
SATLLHQALGEIRAEGEMHSSGLRRLTLELAGADLAGKRSQAYFSDKLNTVVEKAGFEGRLSVRFEGRCSEEGCFENRVFFNGFDLYPEDFPLSMVEVEGQGSFDFDESRFDLDRGSIIGLDQRVFAEGLVDFKEEVFCRFMLSGKDIPFCADLERAIEAIGGGMDYRAFAPMGRADFRFNGGISESDPKVRGQLFIWPQGEASASYEGYLDPVTGLEDAFPYRLDHLRGEIRIHADVVQISGLEGYRTAGAAGQSREIGNGDTGGQVFIHGTVGLPGSGIPERLSISGRDLIWCKELLEGLKRYDPATADALASLDPSGRFDVGVEIFKPPGGDPTTKVQANLKDFMASYPDFPVPIRHLRGRVVQKSAGLIVFENLSGEIGSPGLKAGGSAGRSASMEEDVGQVILDGRLRDGIMETLRIEGRHQRVTPGIKQALRDLLPEGTDAPLALDYEGTLNFLLSLEPGSPEDRFNLVLDFFLDRASGEGLPLVIEDLRGALEIDLNTYHLKGRDLTLRAGGGRFNLKMLEAEFGDRGLKMDLEGEGQHVAIDADLSRMLSDDLLYQWTSLRCAGGVDLKRIVLHLDCDWEGHLNRFASEILLRINNGSVSFPLEIENIHGDLSLDLEKRPGEKETFLLKARSEAMIFEVNDRLFTDVEAAFRLDDEALEFSRFQGTFYGGTIRGRGEIPLRVEFVLPRHFEGNLEVTNGSLKRFFDQGEYAFRNIDGKVDGEIEFHGDLENPHRAVAVGAISVREGSLFELPLFGDLSRLMGNVLSSEPPTFSGGRAEFNYEEGTIHLPEIVLKSNFMELRGNGKANFDGLDLKLIPATGIVPTIPIVGHLVDFIKDGLLTFKVSGRYQDLDVTYDFLVNRIFDKDEIPLTLRYMDRKAFEFDERF